MIQLESLHISSMSVSLDLGEMKLVYMYLSLSLMSVLGTTELSTTTGCNRRLRCGIIIGVLVVLLRIVIIGVLGVMLCV